MTMMRDPFMHFLGVQDGGGDPRTLLGLANRPHSRAEIETALRDRISRVFAHADGRSDDAEIVRTRLREAAEQLTHSHGAPPVPAPAAAASPSRGALSASSAASASPALTGPVLQLTDFDRQVLAVLVSCGGWNAQSRAMIVGVAAAYGASVQGLMKVITGLADYGRRGGKPVGIRDITSGRARFEQAPRPQSTGSRAASGAASGTFDDVSAAVIALPLTEEEQADARRADLWRTFRLSFIFGIITLAAGIALVRLLFPVAISNRADDAQRQALVAPDDDDDEQPAPPPSRTPPQPQPPVKRDAPRVALFDTPPTFTGNGLPEAASNAADGASEALELLQDVQRHASTSSDLAEARFRDWDAALNDIATGWPLLDLAFRRQIEQVMLEILIAAANSPTVTDRLLGSLAAPAGMPADPIDIYRGSWRAGMLGRIADSRDLPPAVTDRAFDQLTISLGELRRSELGFTPAARAWLDRTAEALAERGEFSDALYDMWELWIEAQRELREAQPGSIGEAAHDLSILRALRNLLRHAADLSRPGPLTNVLGRLVTLLEYRDSVVVRDGVIALLEDESIPPQNIWVLLSLISKQSEAEWLGEALVPPGDADLAHRRRVANRLRQEWPAVALVVARAVAAGQGLVIDPELAGQWRSLRHAIDREPIASDTIALMSQLVITSRLNEAAQRLAAHRDEDARALLDAITTALVGESSADQSQSPGGHRLLVTLPQPGAAPAGPPPVDGEWAKLYEEASRNIRDRVALLETLGSSAAGDLGPVDARALVNEVWRGTPSEIRIAAQKVLLARFTSGPIVAIELLNLFPYAPDVSTTHEAITQLTGVSLPSTEAPEWRLAARRALVEHVLSLRPASNPEIDLASTALAESYEMRRSIMLREAGVGNVNISPAEAADRLRQAWLGNAQALIAGNPVPADLPTLSRRHATRLQLAQGPIQRFLADQIGVLELLAYVVAAEQPALAGEASEQIDIASRSRRGRNHAIEQAVMTERAMSALWNIRFAGDDVEPGSLLLDEEKANDESAPVEAPEPERMHNTLRRGVGP